MKKQANRKNRIKITVAAIFIGGILCLLTFLFMKAVQTQLWEQSVNTIMESTQQGANTLRIQLQDDYQSMDAVAGRIQEIPAGKDAQLESLLSSFAKLENGASLYLPTGGCLPKGTERDEAAARLLKQTQAKTGILPPHISSVTGMNVFNIFRKVALPDGTQGYLTKEYEVDSIVDSFSLSFYNNAGFSYVINTQGDVLIRSPHPNSNKTVQNLFDMLPEKENNTDSLNEFAATLKNSKTGWAVFKYQGEDTVFCYTPLKLQTDWYLISIIPKDVVSAQTQDILLRSILLIGCILLGIFLLALTYLRYANRAHRRLRSQADYTAHLYNAIPEGIALIDAQEPYRFLQLNEEGLRLLGYPEGSGSNAVNRQCLEDIIHPTDFEQTRALFRDTAASGKKNIFEVQIKREDQSYFWAAGIVEKTPDENGKPILITAIHDITQEKLAEKEAERKKLQERLTLVGAISNAYPVIVSLNLSSDTLNFIYVRPGLQLNMGTQKSYSQLLRDMAPTIHPDNRDEFERRFALDKLRQTLDSEKKEVFFEAKQMLADETYHWTSTQIIHVDNPYSEDKLAILISRRIDEQRYEEEQQRQVLQTALDTAKAASTAKSQFLTNMSHDIRTPMNAIVGMTTIAAMHIEDRERVQECLKKISLSSKHLLSLINDVLDTSKIESGKLSLRNEPFNFAELIADCMEMVRSQARANQIRFCVHLSVLKNEEVVGDPLRIRQIFINILSNAVKYTLTGGSVAIEVWEESCSRRGYANYIFRCADTGVGMSAGFLEKLFQPFERVQDSTSSKITGTGLGMAITKNLVELMNGDIQVESALGEGSVFTVALPLQPQNVPPEEFPEEWLGVHTLIADDDRQVCENAAELLSAMGLRTRFVTQGEAAVHDVLEAQKTPDPFELCIIDWKMPDMDGLEVARRIRAEVGPDVPVIVLTAYDWSEIENEAKAAGVTAFLAKPFYRSKMCYLLSELSGEKETEPSHTAAPADFAEKRVLVVEDNEMNREIIRTLIEDKGIYVEEAFDGAQAVKLIEESQEGYYNLVFMDIQMPNMNGYQATQAIRALKRQDAAAIPIIAMTADAFEEDVRRALRAGMNAHFAKPIDVKRLDDILHQYLTQA